MYQTDCLSQSWGMQEKNITRMIPCLSSSNIETIISSCGTSCWVWTGSIISFFLFLFLTRFWNVTSGRAHTKTMNYDVFIYLEMVVNTTSLSDFLQMKSEAGHISVLFQNLTKLCRIRCFLEACIDIVISNKTRPGDSKITKFKSYSRPTAQKNHQRNL